MARKKASIKARLTVTSKPSTNVGKAIASDGPIRFSISRVMSRPSSARPKSPTNRRTDLLKKMVSVTVPRPRASGLKNSG